MNIKKPKVEKSVFKRKIQLENYKNCLQASQLENKIIHLNNNNIDVKSLIENHKEFIENKNFNITKKI